MTTEIDYQNNPLHGLSLKDLLKQIVEHYGYEVLYAYLNIQCFSRNPSIDASIKFLKKTDWAREKVEAFYLYQFKSLPRASDEEFEKPPRDRIIPSDQVPGRPAELSLEDAQRLREKRAKKAAEREAGGGQRAGYGQRDAGRPRAPAGAQEDPWAKWKK
ncbi:VF530 family protein [Dechloromonas sp. XY25]|uniref:VF530 family protein n=1 Tax=Dechloromonas hankyongensis TaxID=2908002 RepID=A0ABS9K476_9RHOO|nr:VF530 family protein [Dechloromonas hankyongensis]MCG2577977.1 VF530 family protein [Dechloromonas hankyongensis]